jgi:hypothetical protein
MRRRTYTRDVSSPQISVESSGGDAYRVVVTEPRGTTTHEVTVTAGDVARYAPGVTPERLLEASFEFLLAREPASSILSRFALPVIERYFPEYPREIKRMVYDRGRS